MLRGLSRQGDLLDCLFLVRNGVPFDVAFSLGAGERLAWVVALHELEGRQWDWGAMRWEANR